MDEDLKLRDLFTFAQPKTDKAGNVTGWEYTALPDPPEHSTKSPTAVLHVQLVPLLRNDEAKSASVRQPLYQGYKELQQQVQLVLNSTQPDARVVLQNPYTFVANLQQQGTIPHVIATPALRAIVALASSTSAESGMSHVTDMDSDKRQSQQATSWLSEIYLRCWRFLVSGKLVPLALARIRSIASVVPEPEVEAEEGAAKRPAHR